MSVSIGGMGIISLRTPFIDIARAEFKTLLGTFIFALVLLVVGKQQFLTETPSRSAKSRASTLPRLEGTTPSRFSTSTDHSFLPAAYLTNPTETSFRTFLTEQSFRQHLSRLDYGIDEEDAGLEEAVRVNGHYSPKRPPPNTSNNYDNSNSAFHFANRASVSLRTPKHVFKSFGMFTVAALAPLANPTNDREGSSMADSWFIGAFGHWWRGGVVETWYHDLIARSKDEETWTSGIMAIKALDKLHEYNGAFRRVAFPTGSCN